MRGKCRVWCGCHFERGCANRCADPPPSPVWVAAMRCNLNNNGTIKSAEMSPITERDWSLLHKCIVYRFTLINRQLDCDWRLCMLFETDVSHELEFTTKRKPGLVEIKATDHLTLPKPTCMRLPVPAVGCWECLLNICGLGVGTNVAVHLYAFLPTRMHSLCAGAHVHAERGMEKCHRERARVGAEYAMGDGRSADGRHSATRKKKSGKYFNANEIFPDRGRYTHTHTATSHQRA